MSATRTGFGYSGKWDSHEGLTDLANKLQDVGCPDQQIVWLVNSAAGDCDCNCCSAARRPSIWRRIQDWLNWLVPYPWNRSQIKGV